MFCPTQAHLVAVLSPAGPVDRDAVAEHLARTNAALARDEQIRRAVLVSEPFSIANGLLTSQYKPRRAQILERYETAITAKGDGVDVALIWSRSSATGSHRSSTTWRRASWTWPRTWPTSTA